MYPFDTNPAVNEQLAKMLVSPNNQEKHVVKVNGRAGAEAFSMGPNSDDILLDLNDPIIWFVQTDGAGYKTITPYDISPHKEVSQTDILQSLDNRIAKLEEVLLNGKSDTSTNAKSSTSTSAADTKRNDAGSRGNAQG